MNEPEFILMQSLKAQVADLIKQLAEHSVTCDPLLKRCSDVLADEVDVLIARKVIDSRSPAADALLDYRDPPRTETSSRLANLEQERDYYKSGYRLAMVEVERVAAQKDKLWKALQGVIGVQGTLDVISPPNAMIKIGPIPAAPALDLPKLSGDELERAAEAEREYIDFSGPLKFTGGDRENEELRREIANRNFQAMTRYLGKLFITDIPTDSDFASLLDASMEMLDITPLEMARELKVSPLTVDRWSRGLSQADLVVKTTVIEHLRKVIISRMSPERLPK